MAVNHFRVSRIINEALAAVNQIGTITSVVDAVERAWSRVNSRRLRGDCSEDLAAAEHYLFCRFLIARYSPAYIPILLPLSTVYDMAKVVGVSYGEGSCPPSPVSLEDMGWKSQGMHDGGDDFMGLTRLGMLGAPLRPDRGYLFPSRVHQPGTVISSNVG